MVSVGKKVVVGLISERICRHEPNFSKKMLPYSPMDRHSFPYVLSEFLFEQGNGFFIVSPFIT